MASHFERKFDKDAMTGKRKKRIKDRENMIEDRIHAMVPEVIIAVESLQLATPERVYSCLQQRNINATRSETEMALEHGCKIGVMKERRRYCLNPELRNTLLKESSIDKKSLVDSEEEMNSDKSSYDDECSSVSSIEDDKDSCSGVTVKRFKGEGIEMYSDDCEDTDSADDSDIV